MNGRTRTGSWADRDFWAPEIHPYRGKFYLFGTLSADGVNRGTQVFVADNPLGPFRAHTDRAATPHDWMALDGTPYVENGEPWMVFCHEWVQIADGTMNAVRLESLAVAASHEADLSVTPDALDHCQIVIQVTRSSSHASLLVRFRSVRSTTCLFAA